MEPIQIFPDLLPELTFKASLSGGKGGQHVNKVASKVELYFTIAKSSLLTGHQQKILIEKLAHQLSSTGELRVTCDETRSQNQNKQIAIQKFYEMLETALKPVKKRIKTKVPKAVVRQRINSKKLIGEKKNLRKKPNLE